MSVTKQGLLVCVLAVLGLGLVPTAVEAEVVGRANEASRSSRSRSAWTAERMRAARPLAVELSAGDVAGAERDLAAAGEAVAGAFAEAPGALPLAGIRFHAGRLPSARQDGIRSEVAAAAVGAPAKGTGKAHFTSQGLVPEEAQYEYPYRTVGLVFFHDSSTGNDYACTAAVIRQRVIVTAGQCIHSGDNTPGFYDDWLFVPSYDGGDPFGTWDWEYVAVSSTWAQGGGTVPNAADYGLIELADQSYEGAIRKIGQVTGTLGFVINKLHPNHATIVGYSPNFDSATLQHQVSAQAFKKLTNNNVEHGSDLRMQGAAIIQDFGDVPSAIKWVGTLSYWRNPVGVKLQGASIPDSRFSALMTAVCNRRSGNC